MNGMGLRDHPFHESDLIALCKHTARTTFHPYNIFLRTAIKCAKYSSQIINRFEFFFSLFFVKNFLDLYFYLPKIFSLNFKGYH